ncbi:MAG TPA: hypothetical protein VN442_11545 [Bryobacteraceae bacterium]|nr:hypothetical protein [Bryobacteraceae bacterium]
MVSPEFLEQHKLELPIWTPYGGETRGAHARKVDRAIRAGLSMRPYSATIKDTLAWHKSQGPDGRVRLAGPAPEQETAMLAKWRAAKA